MLRSFPAFGLVVPLLFFLCFLLAERQAFHRLSKNL
jgi:hypothetical protein